MEDMASGGREKAERRRDTESDEDAEEEASSGELAEEGNKEDGQDEDGERSGSLVVAMFGKKRKRQSSSDEFVVKTEVEEDEFQEGDALDNGEEAEREGEDSDTLPVHFKQEAGLAKANNDDKV